MAAVFGGGSGGGGDGGGDDGGGACGRARHRRRQRWHLAWCHQTADSLCAAGLPISGKGRTYGTALSTVVRARALRGGGRRGGAPVGGAPEQERPASGSWRKLVSSPRGAGDEPRFMSRSFGTISAICRRTRGRDRRSARLISGTGTGRQAAHRIHKIRVLRSHPTSMMLSPPTPGIGGEVARSESKQGGAQGLGRAMQAARQEVRKCRSAALSRTTRRSHVPTLGVHPPASGFTRRL